MEGGVRAAVGDEGLEMPEDGTRYVKKHRCVIFTDSRMHRSGCLLRVIA